MHDGCFENGQPVADKVRSMNFDRSPVPVPLTIECSQCRKSFVLATMLQACSGCNMFYGMTPCHCTQAEHAMAAGIGY